MEGYITLGEAAEWLACSQRTITRMIDRGEIDATKLHNRWYVKEVSVEEYISGLSPAQIEVINAKRHEAEKSGR